jgi:methylenetetrahydrofolate dehydrogenase (NADP+) / methenyltetrahydrofolate cyclohydrolase
MKIEAKDIVDGIKGDVTTGVEAHRSKGVAPMVRVIVATDDAAVLSYVRSKVKQAGNMGITMEVVEIGPDQDQAAFEDLVRRSNNDPTIHGVMIELPVRDGLDHDRVLSILDPKKDVDGLTSLHPARRDRRRAGGHPCSGRRPRSHGRQAAGRHADQPQRHRHRRP